jgi:hypothetical protein
VSALPTRADYVAGLRQLADLIATTSGPLPRYAINVSGGLGSGTDVESAAKALNIPFIVQDYDDGARHYRALSMVGPVEIRLSYVEFVDTETTPGEGEQVADPDVGPGSATAPTESSRAGDTDAAPEASAVATTQPEDAAVPAPVARGDGAAVTPADSEWEQAFQALSRRSGTHLRWVSTATVATSIPGGWSNTRARARLDVLHSVGRVDMSNDRSVTGLRGTCWRPRAGSEG